MKGGVLPRLRAGGRERAPDVRRMSALLICAL